MQGTRDQHIERSAAWDESPGRAATGDDLRAWVEAVAGGPTASWEQISGGNRCQSFAVDVSRPDGSRANLYLRYQPPRPPSAEPYTVWREATVYQALQGTAVPAPRLIAVNPDFQAILTDRVPGRADYRRITDEQERVTVAREFIAGLAQLHRLPVSAIPCLTPGATMRDCVRRELGIWQAMYAEAGRGDPLIDLAMDWLLANVPACEGPPVLVHGDAGPGNFLFKDGHLTALLDWELAHPGDPMEDLAWFSMRAVMEPVPDFAGLIAYYGRLTGAPADAARIRYHRVFVSTRVVIIRHRNVTGQPGNSIVSRALNRRLLVTALAEANRIALHPQPELAAAPTARTDLFDSVIKDLRDEIAVPGSDASVVAAAKNAAKVLKYLRDSDRLGATIEARDLAALGALLKQSPGSVEDGHVALLREMRAGRVPFAGVIQFFAASAERDAALAASASGGLADRSFPSIENDRRTDV